MTGWAKDTYFCPMHCEGQKTYEQGGRCPVCKMKLEKKTEAVVAQMNSLQYRVDFKSETPPEANKKVTLDFRLRHTKDDSPIQELEISHEKPMHLIVVSQDLSYFSHEHPEIVKPGELKVDLQFPRGGNYVMFADFTPKGADAQVVPLAIRVEGARPADVPLKVTKGPVTADGYTVALKLDKRPAAGHHTPLSFVIARDGKPVKELQPYLGADGHVVLISEDTTKYVHVHSFGGLSFAATFPKGGLYKAWLQFKHEDKVHTAAFVLRVKD